MWIYYLMALRNLIRFSTQPEFEEDRKQLAAMNDQFNEDMRNWTPETTARLHAAGYRFVRRLGVLLLIVFALCCGWSIMVERHEANDRRDIQEQDKRLHELCMQNIHCVNNPAYVPPDWSKL
jgi:hypothetical protein